MMTYRYKLLILLQKRSIYMLILHVTVNYYYYGSFIIKDSVMSRLVAAHITLDVAR